MSQKMSDDHIELVDYNPEWPKMAADEIAHCIIAKPIIDIQIAVKSLII